jgi:hypothetical protein
MTERVSAAVAVWPVVVASARRPLRYLKVK